MAWLERRGRCYRLSFRLGDQTFRVGLRKANEREAEACRIRVEENLRLVERGQIQLPTGADIGRFLLSDGKLERKVKPLQTQALGSLFARYRETFTAGVKEKNTTKTEGIHLVHLERILGRKTTIQEIGTADIQNYVNGRTAESYRGKTIRPQTIKKEIATLKFVWNWGHRHGHVSARYPAVGIVFPKGKQKEPFRTYEQIQSIVTRGGLTKQRMRELWDGLFLNPTEVAEALEHVNAIAPASWLYPFLFTAAHTGARRSELFRSLMEDFDFINRVVLIREKKKSHETETFRTVDMTPTLEAVLKQVVSDRHQGGPFAFTVNGQDPIDDWTARSAFRKAVAGSKWSVIRGFHTFRHSFASNLAAAGVDQRVIDELMGHQTEEMQRRYRHLFPEKRRAALMTVYG